MVKNAFKMFFQNLLYLFVPMGIFYLFLLVALISFAGAAFGSAAEMIGALAKLVQSTVTASEGTVSEFFAYALEEISWDGNFFDTLAQILDTDWIGRTVRGFFELLDGSSVTFSEEFTAIVTDFAGAVKLQFWVAVSTVVVGFFLANFATRAVVRKRSAPRGVKKWLVANTLVPIVQSLAFAVLCVLVAALQYYAILAGFVMFVGYGILSLISSWLIHGRQIEIKKVVNLNNVVMNLLSAACILLVAIAVFLLLLLFNGLIAVLVLLPLVLYCINVISVNADAYVYSLAGKVREEEAAA